MPEKINQTEIVSVEQLEEKLSESLSVIIEKDNTINELRKKERRVSLGFFRSRFK